MRTEIEAKIKVESLKPIDQRLAELGAEFQSELHQMDCYFNDADDKLTGFGSGLRLRKQCTADNEKILLTYKGPKQNTKFKTRTEIEVEVNDFDDMTGLLAALGYKKILEFEKQRRLWLLDGCEIALDMLPMLGAFIEIEGPDENAIENVLQKLKLSHLPHIDQGYAKMMSNKLDESGVRKTKVLFQD